MKAIEEVDTIFILTRALSPPSEFAILTHSLGRRGVAICFLFWNWLIVYMEVVPIIRLIITSATNKLILLGNKYDIATRKVDMSTHAL